AAQLQVQPGQDLPDINIRLHSSQTYHIRGRIVGSLQTGDSQHARIFLMHRDEMMFFGNQASIGKDQTFDIAGVAPGSYLLSAIEVGGPFRSMAQQPIDLGQADVNDVNLSIVPPGSLHGTIVIEGTPQAGAATATVASSHVSLSPVDMGMPGRFLTGRPNNGGTFTIDDVPAGQYYVSVHAPSGTYLKSVRFGQQDITGNDLDL